MGLIRSRTPTAETTLIANPGVVRALADWDARLVAAREEGRRAGVAEAEGRVKAAEQRAAQAEQLAEARQQQRQQEFTGRFNAPLTALVAAAQRLEPLEKRLIQESEAECVRLALVIAATILRHQVETDPRWLDEVVRRALAEVPDRRMITLRLHPVDAEVVTAQIRDLIAAIPGLEQLDIAPDANLARGACVLMSRGTRLDASVAGCWERLAARLMEVAPAADVAEVVGDAPGGQP